MQGERAIGEASPLHLHLHDAQTPRRLKAAVPDVRLVAVLREPVTRAYSVFSHLVRNGREPAASFAEALALEDEQIAAGWEHIWHYTRMGRYAEQLRRYRPCSPQNSCGSICTTTSSVVRTG